MLDGWMACQRFSHLSFSRVIGRSKSNPGGGEGRLGRTIGGDKVIKYNVNIYHKSIKRPLDNARDDNNGTPKLTVLN